MHSHSFYSDVQHLPHVPLFLGCSGGGGHNAAIDALIKFMLEHKYLNENHLRKYKPVLLSENQNLRLSGDIDWGLYVTHEIPIFSSVVNQFINLTRVFPLLPTRENINNEIENLIKNQKERSFVDMLLDVCPGGYSEVAVWNFLQKTDQTDELTKLISFQEKTDAEKYATVKNYFINLLRNAAKENRPYTEIISTQAMALAALCDAVAEYNENFVHQYRDAKPIKLHQYMTDLPTEGAVHFFNSLCRLTEKQRQQMYLYAVNFNEEIIEKFKLGNSGFAGLFSIDPKNNPMVRPGFRKKNLIPDTPIITLPVQGGPSVPIKIEEQVAAIMLGSQASLDTVKYAMSLAKLNFKKIFVFGGQAEHIKSAFVKEEEYAKYQDRIILLANQDDQHIAPIMARSDVVIQRGGGLSVFEKWAMMERRPNQIILIHTKVKDGKLTSGIIWEDGNVDEFMKTGMPVYRTTVEIFEQQLRELLHKSQQMAQNPPSPEISTYNSQLNMIKSAARQARNAYAFVIKNGLPDSSDKKDRPLLKDAMKKIFSYSFEFQLPEFKNDAAAIEAYIKTTRIEAFKDLCSPEAISKKIDDIFKTFETNQEHLLNMAEMFERMESKNNIDILDKEIPLRLQTLTVLNEHQNYDFSLNSIITLNQKYEDFFAQCQKNYEILQDHQPSLSNVAYLLSQPISNAACSDLIQAIKKSMINYIRQTLNKDTAKNKARAASQDRITDMYDILQLMREKEIPPKELITKIKERLDKFEKGLFKSNAFFKLVGRSELKNKITSVIKKYQAQDAKLNQVANDMFPRQKANNKF